MSYNVEKAVCPCGHKASEHAVVHEGGVSRREFCVLCKCTEFGHRSDKSSLSTR
jgi:hypothetical protein